MDWVQVYDPLGAPWLSTLMAAVPIVVLLGLLVAGQSAPRAAVAGLAVALLIAVAGFGMPTSAALASSGPAVNTLLARRVTPCVARSFHGPSGACSAAGHAASATLSIATGSITYPPPSAAGRPGSA